MNPSRSDDKSTAKLSTTKLRSSTNKYSSCISQWIYVVYFAKFLGCSYWYGCPGANGVTVKSIIKSMFINSLWHSDNIWCRRIWTMLVQVIAWCLAPNDALAPNLYLNKAIIFTIALHGMKLYSCLTIYLVGLLWWHDMYFSMFYLLFHMI